MTAEYSGICYIYISIRRRFPVPRAAGASRVQDMNSITISVISAVCMTEQNYVRSYLAGLEKQPVRRPLYSPVVTVSKKYLSRSGDKNIIVGSCRSIIAVSGGADYSFIGIAYPYSVEIPFSVAQKIKISALSSQRLKISRILRTFPCVSENTIRRTFFSPLGQEKPYTSEEKLSELCI